jgi:hypothetical protein
VSAAASRLRTTIEVSARDGVFDNRGAAICKVAARPERVAGRRNMARRRCITLVIDTRRRFFTGVLPIVSGVERDGMPLSGER